MFSKILIANRGEIACRVIRTCRKLGIKTVAVYSDADAGALHVREADEAVRIGPAPSAESYLVAERIVEACRQTGAQAVHPGYGFLSERAGFARALAEAGITFIGPPASAIEAMGDKIESKKLAEAAGVNTVPGHLAAIPDAETAIGIARGIGYPVMIKASAGGGGKGMRIAHSDAEVREGFQSASNEARASFADDRVFIEKYVEVPRHIEIQVLADGHGNCLYLGERECSIQRRHQKVIEEAPSPFLDPETRRAMGEQAVALARAVGYRSAGTVEFIVDRHRNFYFLEMNTRLQVEHPVTEMVTGIDLVEWMIRVAAGDRLPFAQEDLRLTGWAVEARLYAEDPFRGFLPATGRLTRYRPPQGMDGIRVDAGVYEGAEISMFYDPMICKLVAHGADRAEAVRRLRLALDAFELRGVGHNLPFLAAVMDDPVFRAGELSTNFIAERFPDGFKGAPLPARAPTELLALAAALHQRQAERDASIPGQLPGRRHTPATDWIAWHDKSGRPLSLTAAPHGYDVAVDGRTVSLRGPFEPGLTLFDGQIDGHRRIVQVERRGIAWRLSEGGAAVEVVLLTAAGARAMALMPEKAAADTSKFLLSPMPGLLVRVTVAEGEPVKAGQELCAVEAMKMENILRAPADATIARLHAKPGDSLAVDQRILEFG
ncbi:MAG: acetyl/propionyl/methylcrotonyl-CoA carboxylase subunit alpha [Thalassobaculales bacterium]